MTIEQPGGGETSPPKRIDVLQAGRAIAALAVVVHHAELATTAFSGGFPGDSLFRLGYLGVDFFFVLSGFIIYHSTVGRDRTLGSFAGARLKRVYLPYLPIGIAYGLIYTFLPQLSAGLRDWGWLTTLTLLPVEIEPALSVAWTLQHEVFFYFLFALLYFRGLLWPGLLLWIAAILLVPSSAIPLAIINLEFVMGILAAIAFRRGLGNPMLLLPSFAAFAFWVWMGADRSQSALVGLGIAFLIPVFAKLEQVGRISVARAWVFLGEASYSLYLVHLIPISIVARMFDRWYVSMIIAIAASVAAGIAYHLVVERRVLSWKLTRSSQFATRLLTRPERHRSSS